MSAVQKSRFPKLVLWAMAFILIIGAWTYMRYISQSYSRLYSNTDVIIRALDAYKVDYGLFPPSLNVLEADYLPNIPDPQWGTNEWVYFCTQDGSWFYIKVFQRKGRYENMYYNSFEGEWHGDM